MEFRTRNIIFGLGLLLAGIIVTWRTPRRTEVAEIAHRTIPALWPPRAVSLRVDRRPLIESVRDRPPSPSAVAATSSPRDQRPRPFAPVTVPFVIEDDVAVTMTDLVLGVPERAEPGRGSLQRPATWPHGQVAYFITPGLPNPDRILAALRLFEGTPIHFVPFTNEEDVMVFVPGTGACKSYLGRIGGKQPIWLSPGCGPTEIAHEIMHALGFIHEQNRADRDGFIRVLNENVEPGNEINFARLPKEYLDRSGLAPFDYTSIMIYPKTMFGVGGRDTLESVRPGVEIAPARTLSPADRDRLTKGYGTGAAPVNSAGSASEISR